MGSIRLTPAGPFVAGSFAELTLVYTAGTFGIDDTGMVKVSWRTTSDMAKPQFDKPQAANFTTVEASNGAKLEVWYDRLNIRPYVNTLLIRVGRGYLRAGRHAHHPLRRQAAGLARLAAADQRREERRAEDLDRRLCHLRILRAAGAAGVRSRARPGDDVEGDPSFARRHRRAVPAGARRRGHVGQSDHDKAEQTLALTASLPLRGLPRERRHQARRRPARDRKSRGRARRATSSCASWLAAQEVARANPLRVVKAATLKRYWGDLHGQSGETVGMGSAEDYFRYRARPRLRRHGRPPGQRLPDHRRVLEEAQRADRRVRQARTVRLPSRLRMVRQHRHGRRPQRLLPPRGPADPPLVAHPGRRPDFDRRDLHRRQAVRGAERRGRHRDRPCRRALRRREIRP